SSDGTTPWDVIALVSGYIRRGKVKTKVFKPLIRNGYVEGQFNLLLDWNEIRRLIVSREIHGPRIDLGPDEYSSKIESQRTIAPPGGQGPTPYNATEIELPANDDNAIEDIIEEEIIEGMPFAQVLHDCDVLVLPHSSDSVEEALENGGVVVIVERWTKETIDQRIKDGIIRKEEGEMLKKEMRHVSELAQDPSKSLNEAVG